MATLRHTTPISVLSSPPGLRLGYLGGHFGEVPRKRPVPSVATQTATAKSEVVVDRSLPGISHVALALWGSSRYWPILWVVNRDRVGKAERIDYIAVGQRLRVPTKISAADLIIAREGEESWCRSSPWAGAIKKCPGMPLLEGEGGDPPRQVPKEERPPPPPESVQNQARAEIEATRDAVGTDTVAPGITAGSGQGVPGVDITSVSVPESGGIGAGLRRVALPLVALGVAGVVAFLVLKWVKEKQPA